MKKYILVFSVVLLANMLLSPALATDISQYDKVIWINQLKQTGEAYEGGKRSWSFRC